MAIVLDKLIIRGPTWISVDNTNPLPGATGVCIMQIFFQGSVNIHLIKFKNYYIHNLTVKCRSTEDTATSECNCGAEILPHIPWKNSITRKVLMPSPDYADGCQDYIFIYANESLTEWSNISALLLILRQPSSHWKMFSIKELEILGQQNEAAALLPMPAMATSETSFTEKEKESGSEDVKISEDLGLSAEILSQIEVVRDLFREIQKLKL